MKLRGTREQRWVAVYAAELVRRIAARQPGIRVDLYDGLILSEMEEAASLADWADECDKSEPDPTEAEKRLADWED